MKLFNHFQRHGRRFKFSEPLSHFISPSLTRTHMEKRLRFSLRSSADEFLSTARNLSLKSAKSSLKTLLFSVRPSSDVSVSLPLALNSAISNSINSFKDALHPENPRSPASPPSKRLRRSSRSSRTRQSPPPSTGATEAEKKWILQTLQIYAHTAYICAIHPKRAFSPENLLPAVRELHDNLILFESDSVLLSEVSILCEEWWKEQLPGREVLISQFLPFLVSRSLMLKKKVDVHRIYVLREAFLLFDFEDGSIEDLRLLLVRCVIAPLYLKTEEGRKFIAFTFGLSLQLLKETMAMIKSQIPFGRKTMLEAYADIIFRGWKSVEGDFKCEIEHGFLQGLVEGAILASSGSLAASIRRVLGGFVNQRTSDGVEKLLFRLAEPVIFRFLQVANSNVRQNALHLLLDLFPLEDPDATKEDKDALLDRQFFLLERLLTDDCLDVRVIAVEGCCRVLHLFWEIIPSSTITKLLTRIFDDMSHDAANEVRLSMLNGVIYLMGNPQSHEILKVLLARAGHLILDSVLSVRLALADLLILLRDMRGFQFNKIVGLDELLTALANDHPHVAQKITRLLLPAYFPSKIGVAEACNRCLTLIKRFPTAGARFCEFAASEGASLKSLTELVRLLVHIVLSPDNASPDQIDGILSAAAHICRSLASDAHCKKVLNELFSREKIQGLLAIAGTSCAKSSLFNVFTSVSPVNFAGLLHECVSLVTKCTGLTENIEKQAEVRSAHKLVLSCNWFNDILEALSSLLQLSALACHNKFSTEIPRQLIPSAKRKKNKPNKISAGKTHENGPSTFEDRYHIAMGAAWQIKDFLMCDSSCRAMLDSDYLELVLGSLKVISEVSIVHCVCSDFMDATPVVAYTALSLHLALQNVSSSDADVHRSRTTFGLASSGSSLEGASFEQEVDHLLHCTEKILPEDGSAMFGLIPSECRQCISRETCPNRKHVGSQNGASGADNDGSVLITGKRVLNATKIFTALLKFFVDAYIVGFASHNQRRCQRFASAYIRYLIISVKQCSRDEVQFEEEQLRELFLCLKSSFSYASKLLNLALASDSEEEFLAPPETYNLANRLLDLVASVESYCSSAHAARLVAVSKQWLPDFILALGSTYMLKPSLEEITSQNTPGDRGLHFRSWTSVLADVELGQLRSVGSDEETERVADQENFPAFNIIIALMLPLMRANSVVLDAAAVNFLVCSATALEWREFNVALGILQFVFVKLINIEDGELERVDMVSTYLQELYALVESKIEELRGCDVGEDELLAVRSLLEPAWLYVCETRGMT